MSKYHSRKITVDGITYDSRKEYFRWQELSLLEKAGQITNLQRQVKFELIPAQYLPVETEKGLKEYCVERAVTYIADFVYWKDGQKIVEDTKGFKTPEYRIKKKMMLWVHGIQIKET